MVVERERAPLRPWDLDNKLRFLREAAEGVISEHSHSAGTVDVLASSGFALDHVRTMDSPAPMTVRDTTAVLCRAR